MRKIFITIFLLYLSTVFVACGTANKKEVDIVAASNDGNLAGNIISDAKILNDGSTYFFKNPKDEEKLYYLDKDGYIYKMSDDINMKDMHISDYCIYYVNSDPENIDTDKNLYRFSIEREESKKLTDLEFDQGNDSWLNLNSLVDGSCYFSYCRGKDDSYHIAKIDTNGKNLKELYEIPSDNTLGNPMVNVVGDRYLFFLSNDGLNCYDIKKEKNTVQIPYFECKSYIIYDGNIYYVRGSNLKSIGLDANNEENIYDGSDLDFNADSIFFNIYKDKIYLLAKSDDQKVGSLKSMNLDGSDVEDIDDEVRWFNIVNGNVFLEYYEGENSSTEMYTYNIAQDTEIGQLPNIDTLDEDTTLEETAAIEITAQENKSESKVVETKVVENKKDDNYYMDKYAPVINVYKKVKDSGKDYLSEKEQSYIGNYVSPRNIEYFMYDFIDINNNGSKEMVVVDTESSEKHIEAIYTLHGGDPEFLEYFMRNMAESEVCILNNGYICNYRGHSGSYYTEISKLDSNDNKIIINRYEYYEGTIDEDFKNAHYKINDVEVTEDEYVEALKYFNNVKYILVSKYF